MKYSEICPVCKEEITLWYVISQIYLSLSNVNSHQLYRFDMIYGYFSGLKNSAGCWIV